MSMRHSDSKPNSDATFFDRRPDPDWQRAHAELERLARTRARLESEEGYWLLSALRSRAHVELGYGSFAEYVERLFGYDARSAKEKLRVAEALEQLPDLRRALSEGALSWSAARELTRVATAETEAQWLEAARGKTLREVERQVSGRRPGDRPRDAARDQALRHVLRFEVGAETLGAVREAMVKLRRDSGSALDDDAALLLMARHVLGGPTDDGRSSYQMLLSVCERCGRGELEARGELVEVGPEVVEMASCDAQRIRAVEVEHHAELGAERHSVTHVGHEGDHAPQHESVTRVGRNGRAQAEAEHDVRRGGHAEPRATQDLPPAIRRSVMRRDRGCCVVPGCRNAVFVDVHHLSPRSEGGDHDPDGLAVLCAAHHRAAHRGQLLIEGRVSTGLTFRHADGRRYGEAVCAARAGAWADVFRALRSMGFAETETRRALEKTRSDLGELDELPGVERLLRRALGVLMDARGQRQPMPRTSPNSGFCAFATNAARAG
jgi:hypothetical protein